jgi:hypothetical protein
MENPAIKPLGVEIRYNLCDPDQLEFDTTSYLETLTQILGQPRAIEEVEFGVGINEEGNVVHYC